MTLPPYVQKDKYSGWILSIRVQPGAKKTEIAGELDGRLRIRLAAPAVENKANIALVAFVAKILGIKTGKVSLLSGDTSRIKRLHIDTETINWEHLLRESE